MSSIAYKCPNCGGSLMLDPETRKLACQMCESQFDVEDVRDVPESETHISVYSCPSCGAELVTDETTAATQCYYCHSPVVLSGRLVDELRPDVVAPFSVDSDDAEKRFEKWTSKKRFAPKSFFKQRAEGLKGIYYPYWQGSFECDASFDGQATNVSRVTTRTHIVETTRHYHVTREGTIHFKHIMRSALQKADRTLADGVMPYADQQDKPFHAGYLTGFTAESRDVTSADVEPGILSELQGYTKPLLTQDTSYNTLNGTSRCSIRKSKYLYKLLPAWIFTYKDGKGKIFTYSMNGQTGKVCGRLPIDPGRLVLACAVLGVLVCVAAMVGGYFLW